MTALMAVSSTQSPVLQAGPPVQVRLPVGGWQVGFRAQPDGRTVIEVTDQDGSLIGLAASIRLPFLWIDAAWACYASGPGGARQWWSLAIGHVPVDAGQPTVTFTRRARRARHGRMAVPPEAVDGLWVVHDGLWVAAATGRYTRVRLTTARSAPRIRRLRLVTADPCRTDPVTP